MATYFYMELISLNIFERGPTIQQSADFYVLSDLDAKITHHLSGKL